MRTAPLVALVGALLLFSPSASAARSSSGYSSHNHSYSSRSHSSGGTTHVRGYVRKDGTYVQPHERRSTGTHAPRTYHPRVHSSYVPRAGVERDSHGHLKRSVVAKDEFRRMHPCPCTGRTTGPCPGYVIDHIVALKHGGPDAPSNMQWQTKADAKAKDKIE